jgi:hypothetical protein
VFRNRGLAVTYRVSQAITRGGALLFAHLLIACSIVAPADEPAISVPLSDSPSGATVALVDVNVVTMDDAQLLRNQTVVLRGERIESMAPTANAGAPPDAFVIRGEGKLYVIPGLADAHVHMLDRDEMWLYLANGITTVRNMHGLGRHLAWRDSIARGTLIGPRIFTSGPILDGDPPLRSTNIVVRSAAEARAAVADQLAQGFDSRDVFGTCGGGGHQRSAGRRAHTNRGRPRWGAGFAGALGDRARRGLSPVIR